jgi:hypothetical protein
MLSLSRLIPRNRNRSISNYDQRQIWGLVTLVSGRILILPALEELEELLSSSFLEKTHERALHSLHLSARHLGDPAVTINEATSDLLELEVSGDLSVNENLRQFTRSNDEFGNEVDGVVPVAPKLRWRGFIRAEFAVEL